VPKNTYKKGQSGNPAGRPKGARGVAQQYLTEVSRPAEGNSAEQLSRLQQLIRTQVDKAVKGDNRAIEKVVDRIEALDAKFEATSDKRFAFTDADKEVMEEIWRRLKGESGQ
jgi:hypothetical protein